LANRNAKTSLQCLLNLILISAPRWLTKVSERHNASAVVARHRELMARTSAKQPDDEPAFGNFGTLCPAERAGMFTVSLRRWHPPLGAAASAGVGTVHSAQRRVPSWLIAEAGGRRGYFLAALPPGRAQHGGEFPEESGRRPILADVAHSLTQPMASRGFSLQTDLAAKRLCTITSDGQPVFECADFKAHPNEFCFCCRKRHLLYWRRASHAAVPSC
jgi:hypothetical protein